jgi:serine/threonine protein kinase
MAANFDLREKLGVGHFGEVWLAVDTGLNVERAVKLIPPSKVLNPKNFFHEAQILKAAEHQNVVRVEETGKMSDGRIYVAMEYLPKGSLEDEARGAYVELTRAKKIMIDALRGLEHAHSKNILHRDIKPANILIGQNSEGKLSDFGLAISMSINLSALGVKDYAYFLHLAPEVHQRHKYSVASDIFACGITLYRLVNGDSYLPSLLPSEIKNACIQGTFPDRTRYREFIPKALKCIINKALHLDPLKRYSSAKEMRRALEQVCIEMNWNEKALSNGYRWTCGWGNKCYEVMRTQEPDSGWSIIVQRGGSKTSLRRITALCKEGLSQAKAEQMTRRILQDFVLGRIK